jgi:energy-coupling factor transporter ATP-binding protein EcfA2
MAGLYDNIQEVLTDVGDFARDLCEDTLDPFSIRFGFERSPSSGEHRGDPMVLILGNHSSGKSTFINFMIGAEVQKTGLAPIDDGFTLLMHGDPDDKDGAAAVSNPELAFGDLGKFGPRLIGHLKFKRRPLDFLKGLCLVDSPGMIDAADAQLGRGYDFVATVRWFVERSDVVLMLFDPDKPGTTGETLRVFTSALSDVDHKLLIVLSRTDQFRTLSDFARTYGTLCWNLSKVIHRKDLPIIYNTYVPVEGAPAPAIPLKDFEDARQEVIGEVRRAPARRIDNILTRLYDHARRLKMHARVCSAGVRNARKIWMQFLGLGIGAGLIGFAVAWLTWVFGAPWYATGGVALGGLLAGFGLYAFGRFQARSRWREMLEGLTGLFESVYHNELMLSGAADDLKAQWNLIKERTRTALETLGFDDIRPLKPAEERKLDEIVGQTIPERRAKIHKALVDLAAAGKYDGPVPSTPAKKPPQ